MGDSDSMVNFIIVFILLQFKKQKSCMALQWWYPDKWKEFQRNFWFLGIDLEPRLNSRGKFLAQHEENVLKLFYSLADVDQWLSVRPCTKRLLVLFPVRAYALMFLFLSLPLPLPLKSIKHSFKNCIKKYKPFLQNHTIHESVCGLWD